MHDIEREWLVGLADKLDALDLTDEEQAMLSELFERASQFQPEVSGFDPRYDGDRSGSDLSRMSFNIGRGLGLFTGGLGLKGPGDLRPPPP